MSERDLARDWAVRYRLREFELAIMIEHATEEMGPGSQYQRLQFLATGRTPQRLLAAQSLVERHDVG